LWHDDCITDSGMQMIEMRKIDNMYEIDSKVVNLTELNFKKEVLGHKGLYLVEFGVDWCGTCHIVAPILEKLSQKYATLVMVGWVDSEYNKNLTEMYGIINHPTILFFHRGEIIDHLIGSFAYEEITQRIENVLSNKANLISETKSNNNKEK